LYEFHIPNPRLHEHIFKKRKMTEYTNENVLEDLPQERTRIVTDVDADDSNESDHDNNENEEESRVEEPKVISKDEEIIPQPDVILENLVAAVDELSLQDNNEDDKVTVDVPQTEDIDNANDNENINTDTDTDALIVTKKNALPLIEAAAHYEVNKKYSDLSQTRLHYTLPLLPTTTYSCLARSLSKSDCVPTKQNYLLHWSLSLSLINVFLLIFVLYVLSVLSKCISCCCCHMRLLKTKK